MICRICGKEFEKSKWYKPYHDICSSECYVDNFWQEIINEKDYHVIVDGVCYYYDPNKIINTNLPQYNSYAGRIFKILFNDGRIVLTNNLWCNGDIPEKFREQLPDNAVFEKVSKEDYNKIYK